MMLDNHLEELASALESFDSSVRAELRDLTNDALRSLQDQLWMDRPAKKAHSDAVSRLERLLANERHHRKRQPEGQRGHLGD